RCWAGSWPASGRARKSGGAFSAREVSPKPSRRTCGTGARRRWGATRDRNNRLASRDHLWLADRRHSGGAMIDPAILVPYILACFLFSIVPGPSVSIVVANALGGGTRAGLLTILGTELS